MRGTYQHYERRLGKMYYVACIIVSLPVVSLIAAQKIFDESLHVVAYTFLYFIVCWSTLTALYSSTLLALMQAIWRFHRYEFY